MLLPPKAYLKPMPALWLIWFPCICCGSAWLTLEAAAPHEATPERALRPHASPTQSTLEACKKRAARSAVAFVLRQHPDARVIGIGSGSTIRFVIQYLGQLTAQGALSPHVLYVPTSRATSALLQEAGLRCTTLDQHDHVDVGIDGADAIDPQLNCIKGGGGAHWQEKRVASRARLWVLVADHTKLAPALGTRWSQGIPLEVVPHQWPQVAQAVDQLGGRAALRRSRQGQAVVTDQGNSIVDAQFDTFDPAALDSKLAALPGVLATGLFLQMADYAFVGMPDGSRRP